MSDDIQNQDGHCPSPLRGEGGRRSLTDEGLGALKTPHPSPLRAGTFSPEGRRAGLAVGVGFRKAATADTLAALVRDALSRLPPELAGLPASLVTIAEKDRPALREAAALLGLPVRILTKAALSGTENCITVTSEAARACHGIPSVAEASALAAAGPGARLLVTRIAVADATCAIAAASDSSGPTRSGPLHRASPGPPPPLREGGIARPAPYSSPVERRRGTTRRVVEGADRVRPSPTSETRDP